MADRGKVDGGGGVKLMVGIKDRTWDEHQLRYGSVELLYRTPETNITLLHSYCVS